MKYTSCMKTIRINYLSMTNFICFREKQEIFFDKLSNIISVIGENRDTKIPDSKIKSSNGSGKSTVAEALYYSIFGETIKKFGKNNQIIHNLSSDGVATVECIFNDEYRIVRTQKKGGAGVRLWQSKEKNWDKDTEITRSTKAETDKYIVELVGLSPEAFVNIALFSDDQKGCFLECDAKAKRDVIEALMSLSVYREWQEKANQLVNSTKAELKELKRLHQAIEDNLLSCKAAYNDSVKKDEQWKITLKQERDNLIKKAKAKKEELESSDTGAEILLYQAAQEKIPVLQQEIINLEASQEILKKKNENSGKILEELRREQGELLTNLKDFNRRMTSNSGEVDKLIQHIKDLQANKHGTKCNHCFGVVDFSNIEPLIQSDKDKIEEYNKLISVDKEEVKILQEVGAKRKTEIESMESLRKKDEENYRNSEASLKKLRSDLTFNLSVKEPQADSKSLILKTEIEQIKIEAKEKNDQLNSGITPFVDLIASNKKRMEDVELSMADHEKKMKQAESNIPYYEYWRIGFGDNGIRQSILEGIIPVLNQCVASWLQPLVSNTITLKFNSNLEETIERNPSDGDPYVYSGMSAGQRRRLNLAVSQAFADIMAVSNGTKPSLIFLDEVTTNIDPMGVQGIYNMIQELSKDKQVFITTHDHDLLEMLENTDTIKLIHEGGRTVIETIICKK
jgi:DNA repair exonuclease SbcCD ATPase subunit